MKILNRQLILKKIMAGRRRRRHAGGEINSLVQEMIVWAGIE